MQAPAKARYHEALRKRLPYEVIPTNIEGAFASPAPPENFDPKSASAASLIKHGVLWRRPTKRDHPGVVAAWEKVFSRPWHAKDRIVPFLKPQLGRSHQLRAFKKTEALGARHK
jgi:hypothetical protein